MRSTDSYVKRPILYECYAYGITDGAIISDPDGESTALERLELERPRIEGGESEDPERANLVKTWSRWEIKNQAGLLRL